MEKNQNYYCAGCPTSAVRVGKTKKKVGKVKKFQVVRIIWTKNVVGGGGLGGVGFHVSLQGYAKNVTPKITETIRKYP